MTCVAVGTRHVSRKYLKSPGHSRHNTKLGTTMASPCPSIQTEDAMDTTASGGYDPEEDELSDVIPSSEDDGDGDSYDELKQDVCWLFPPLKDN